MGRTMLIVGILMSTIFAGIIISLQRRMRNLPDTVVRNMLTKEAENVSDYALRTAIRNAGTMGFAVPTEGLMDFTQHFDDFVVGHCHVDSIRYQFVDSAQHYRAFTYIRATMMGVTVNYTAEMAFNFPLSVAVGGPNCFYFEMDQPQFHGSNEYVVDTSPNDYTGDTMNGVDTRPHGSGANGWKCASYDGVNDYMCIVCQPGCSEHPNLVITSEMTIVVFAKVRTETTTNQGTLVWLASDPYDTGTPSAGHPGANLRNKPTGAIWFERSNNTMRFTATLDNTSYTTVEAAVPYTPVGKWPHNKDPWHFFGMTLKWGILRAYINGVKVATVYSGFLNNPIPNRYGVSVARRDIRVAGTTQAQYKYFFGLMDQAGLYNRALSDAEMYSLYITTIRPENILYIRD